MGGEFPPFFMSETRHGWKLVIGKKPEIITQNGKFLEN